jgi:hypothetical protein
MEDNIDFFEEIYELCQEANNPHKEHQHEIRNHSALYS